VRDSRGRGRRKTTAFVFAVVGDKHVATVSIAINFLKQFTKADIAVILARSEIAPAHDQVIRADVPGHLDDHQASIYLKTGLYKYVTGLADVCCYLDSDVIAVRGEADDVFAELRAPVSFAADNVDIDTFSSWAVNCGCHPERCGHLRDAIRRKFSVDIPSGNWICRNGGVFVFDRDSAEFLAAWHRRSMRILGDPEWKTRDQGALAATIWAHGLQDHALLPREFNLIVDRMWNIPAARRAIAQVSDFKFRDEYSISRGPGSTAPRLIHFINGGVGQVGWRHWDEVAALLSPQPRRRGFRAMLPYQRR
jgi:hypothetical protein